MPPHAPYTHVTASKAVINSPTLPLKHLRAQGSCCGSGSIEQTEKKQAVPARQAGSDEQAEVPLHRTSTHWLHWGVGRTRGRMGKRGLNVEPPSTTMMLPPVPDLPPRPDPPVPDRPPKPPVPERPPKPPPLVAPVVKLPPLPPVVPPLVVTPPVVPPLVVTLPVVTPLEPVVLVPNPPAPVLPEVVPLEGPVVTVVSDELVTELPVVVGIGPVALPRPDAPPTAPGSLSSKGVRAPQLAAKSAAAPKAKMTSGRISGLLRRARERRDRRKGYHLFRSL
jgi:hypothetical protein